MGSACDLTLPHLDKLSLCNLNDKTQLDIMASAVKVFKKTAPNGKVTVYLGRRDFVDNTQGTDPVDGVVVFDNDYLRGRKVYASVVVVYRFGREEDEVMGLTFSKELELCSQQIYPAANSASPNEVQDRLMKKLGGNAHPFNVTLPEMAPSSVVLQNDEASKPIGVLYELRVFVADSSKEKRHKRNSVTLAVRKVQYAPAERCTRQPSTLVPKGFALSSGKLNLEVTLEKDIYYHGEQVAANLNISNGSRKTVKSIACTVVQHVEVTMTNTQFTRDVSSMESKEGCPITPGSNLTKKFMLHPCASTNKNTHGIALDGKVKDSDANLASSTLMSQGQNPNDVLGIVISYSARVALNCGAMGGELVADLPFKLVHPSPSSGKGAGDNIVFEDFAKIRRGMSIDQS